MSRTLLSTLALLAAAVLAFASLTHGFTVLTAESARRQSVADTPIEVPELSGIDQQGRRRPLIDPTDQRIMIVDFIYARCTSICSALGSTYQQMQSAIARAHLEQAVRLVTVSFDPKDDTAAVIHDYAKGLTADPAVWTLLTPLDPVALRRSLDVFGVVTKPLPDGQFLHNAAFHIIDRHGRLARIIDTTQPDEALAVARQLHDAP